MAEQLSRQRRSWNMSRIRGKDTTPELLVRSILHRMGFRFRVNHRDLPGKPDIVLSKYRTVLFVHGCYWHRHPQCANATTPSTNQPFWEHKFATTKERDARNQQMLKSLGWTVGVIWECAIRKDPVLAVNNALIDLGLLDDDAPYPELETDALCSSVRERFKASWSRSKHNKK